MSLRLHHARRLEDSCDQAAADALLTFDRATVPALQETLRDRLPLAEDQSPVRMPCAVETKEKTP